MSTTLDLPGMIFLTSMKEELDHYNVDHHHPLPSLPPPQQPVHHNVCSACSYHIYDKDIYVSGDRLFHERCMRCAVCSVTLPPADRYWTREGLMYCRADYLK
ncbi:unnamed protein product, partial [Mesorhabditis spiculigera]